MWQALYGSAWLMALGLPIQAMWIGAFAIAGFICPAAGHPGHRARALHVVVPGDPGGDVVQHTYRTDDSAAYFRLIQGMSWTASRRGTKR
jgi:hypothetical protein